jgi:hypothetical protein
MFSEKTYGHTRVDCQTLAWLKVISGWYNIFESGASESSMGQIKIAVGIHTDFIAERD